MKLRRRSWSAEFRVAFFVLLNSNHRFLRQVSLLEGIPSSKAKESPRNSSKAATLDTNATFTCVKDNVFKNKRVLMESIHKSRLRKPEKNLSDQFEAKRAKNKASRERKHARREERLANGSWSPGGDVAPVTALYPLLLLLQLLKLQSPD